MKNILIIGIMLLTMISFSGKHNIPDVNNFLDEWHNDAAEANFDAYFSKLDNDAIYLGTQWDERWTKQEFANFSKPYFDKGKAWDFKAFRREFYSSEDQKLIWFEESLKTWMGVCRGSGVLRNYGDSLKIVHYNLALTISNNLVRDFVELVKQDSINSFLIEE
ncbi:MAG: nuclear transport factor 2 family protein [Bacteroidota bacterium]|nr:nuclear transport factor 2 family protein [Bacteroidota bacterium]